MTKNQISYLNYLEEVRANKEKERENKRANQAKEKETNRSNLVSEHFDQMKEDRERVFGAAKIGIDWVNAKVGAVFGRGGFTGLVKSLA